MVKLPVVVFKSIPGAVPLVEETLVKVIPNAVLSMSTPLAVPVLIVPLVELIVPELLAERPVTSVVVMSRSLKVKVALPELVMSTPVLVGFEIVVPPLT